MAGIGFELRRMLRKNTLTGLLQARWRAAQLRRSGGFYLAL